MSTDQEIKAQRMAYALSQPFKPFQPLSGLPSEEGPELRRIAWAAEYAAGQLFEIRKLLESKKVDGGEL